MNGVTVWAVVATAVACAAIAVAWGAERRARAATAAEPVLRMALAVLYADTPALLRERLGDLRAEMRFLRPWPELRLAACERGASGWRTALGDVPLPCAMPSQPPSGKTQARAWADAHVDANPQHAVNVSSDGCDAKCVTCGAGVGLVTGRRL